MMEQRDQEEEKNKRIGWLTSLGVQLVLLVLFYFIVAWREPFPPIPEYGIELGFVSSSGASAASSPTQPVDQEETEEELVEETVSQEVVKADVPSTEVQPETPTQEVEDMPVVQEKSTADKVVEKKQEVDQRAVMKPTEEVGNNTNPSNGKEAEEKVDERAIYGNQGDNTGSSEGASLALAGWIWDFKPEPDDQSDQSGKIVYKIVVDQDGYLIKIETVTSSVSPAVERKYRQAVEKLTFSKTADYQVANLSTGTITFIIKSR